MSALPAASVDDDLLVTAEGYAQLCADLEALRTLRRHEMTEHLREVRQDGDPDNPMLFDLLEEHVQLEARINLLEAQVAVARVVTPAGDGTAAVGTSVRVRHVDSGQEAEYALVGPIESGVGNGRVSIGSPVGRALVGRRRGETVAVETPRGTTHLEILCVRCPNRSTANEAA